MKYFIYQNPEDTRNLDLKNDITANLETIVTHPTQADLIIVLGGDGTMIEAIQDLHSYNKPLFGVNCGTLGFLLNDVTSVDDIPQSTEALQYITEPFIDATIENSEGAIEENILAVNDIVLNSFIPNYPKFDIHKSGELLKTLQGSSLIISSAIGSTGYRANFDGPLIPTGQNDMGLMGVGTGGFKYSLMKGPYPYSITIQAREIIDAYIDGKYKIYKDIKKIHYKPSENTFTLAFKKQDFHEKRLQLHSSKLERNL